MHEILTVQCGNRANFLGTHFWNFQEQYFLDAENELDHDVLYQAGVSPGGMETYLPRVLIYDCARNMGTLRRINQLYETPVQNDAPSEVVRPETINEHPFQSSLDLSPDAALLTDENVRYWSDYNMQFYRAASYMPIDSTAVERPLLTYEQGIAAFKERDRESTIMDEEFRPFLEQCDLLQGFSILSSVCDGWSGFAAEMLLELDNEYPKLSKYFINAGEPTSREEHLNQAEGILAVNEIVDIFVPTTASPSWRGSASSGSWLDTITLPMRTRKSLLRMSDLGSFMSANHKILQAQLGEQRLSPIIGDYQKNFMVERGSNVSLGSRLLDGRLHTVYTHPQEMSQPASFPREYTSASASINYSPRGTRAWLQGTRRQLDMIASRSGFSERKVLSEALREFEGSFAREFEEQSDISSDDDGF